VSTFVKQWFNFQFPFILWVGSTNGALTTDFPMWTRSSSSLVTVQNGGAFTSLSSTGSASIVLLNSIFGGVAADETTWSTKSLILDFWAKFESGSGDFNLTFFDSTGGAAACQSVYNSTVYNKVGFTVNANTTIYATIAKAATGVTNTSVSSGITLTNWNNYRVEFNPGVNALFYINGVLKATLSGANLPTGSNAVCIGFGRNGDGNLDFTAPNAAVKMV